MTFFVVIFVVKYGTVIVKQHKYLLNYIINVLAKIFYNVREIFSIFTLLVYYK